MCARRRGGVRWLDEEVYARGWASDSSLHPTHPFAIVAMFFQGRVPLARVLAGASEGPTGIRHGSVRHDEGELGIVRASGHHVAGVAVVCVSKSTTGMLIMIKGVRLLQRTRMLQPVNSDQKTHTENKRDSDRRATHTAR